VSEYAPQPRSGSRHFVMQMALMCEAYLPERDEWFSNPHTLRLGESLRPTAELYLQETPERYFYPPEWRGRVRVSYMEP
jgi:hypothetical protein